MASEISDDHNGAHASSSDKLLSEDEPQAEPLAETDTKDEELAADTAGAPPEPANHDLVQDSELIEMLEQLNETLDEANTAFAEQQVLVSQMAASADDQPQMPPVAPPVSTAAEESRTSIMTFMVAGMGSVLAIAAVGATWLFLNSHDTAVVVRDDANTLRVGRHVAASSSGIDSGTTVSRKPEVAQRPAVPVEKPIQEPLTSATNAATAKPPKSAADAAPTVSTKPVETAPVRNSVVRLDVEKTAPPVPAVQELVKSEPAVPAPTIQPEEEAAILERGNRLMRDGDIAAARLAFEYGAARGSADAMFELGRSYDPDHLRTSDAIGITPDVETALKWYVRAADLGHDAANARVGELEKLARN